MKLLNLLFPALALAAVGISTSCQREASAGGADPVARGRYLVQSIGCADCHSPHGPDGEVIPGRDLSGHPADAPLPTWDPSLLARNSVATIAPTLTAFAGPFGVSVAPNLTPDVETGTGSLTADGLVKSWKSGRHWQLDRPVMPPMPIAGYGNLDEADIRAVHAYLHSLKPLKNAAPKSTPAPMPGK